MYARDKYAAIQGTWRVPEATLHLVEAVGGWPGAYVAQQTMRHKTVKISCQVSFCLMVTLHVAFWIAWLFDLGLVRTTHATSLRSLGRTPARHRLRKPDSRQCPGRPGQGLLYSLLRI